MNAKKRNALPSSQFAEPGSRKYPVNDQAHAANAKARATQQVNRGNLSASEAARTTKWSDFLRTHWESMAACDSFAVEAWTKGGLVRFLVFFVIHLSSRRVHIAGIHADPAEPQMLQTARNLTDCDDGFLKGKWFLIQDRDPLYTRRFRATLRATGVRSVRLPKWSPNLNCFAERFVLSARQECLDKIILFGEQHLRYVIEQYVQHFNTERPHQGLGNERIGGEPLPTEGEVQCRERLGGLLKSYYREAA